MARQSLVLLKNEKNILPLKKNLKKIVVLGPNADNPVTQLGNYNGNPSKLTTILQGIKEKVGKETQVVYEKAVNYTNNNILVYTDITSQYTMDGKPGLKAEYFNNKDLKGKPAAVIFEKNLDHFWQEGVNVVENVPANDFSARYSTNFKATNNNPITFELEADDGFRFIINGKVIFDSWAKKRKDVASYKLETKKDSTYHIVVEYWQGDGKANIKLSTGNTIATDYNALTKRTADADAYIFVGGISPQLEGEAMKVNDPGFNGGDRTTIMLPTAQTDLMKALSSTGKPVVFVMMTGSAIATPWESEHVAAILNAWYSGQSAGTAVADILFGDYNPSGRLPITFYKSDSDLPPFNNYSMENRTYRYFTGKPLYGFGYGLSYSSFLYDSLVVSTNAVAGENVPVAVRITNTGKMAGDEVVQLYVASEDKSIKTPLKSLKGFQRISLKASESRLVNFTLSTADLSYVDANGSSHPFIGKIKIFVGGNQPDEPNPTNGNIITKEILVKTK